MVGLCLVAIERGNLRFYTEGETAQIYRLIGAKLEKLDAEAKAAAPGVSNG